MPVAVTEYEFEEVTLTLAPVDGVVEGVPVDVPVRLCVEELDGLTPVLSEAVAVTLTVAVRLCVAEALAAAAVEGLGEGDAAPSETVSVFVKCVPSLTLTKTP